MKRIYRIRLRATLDIEADFTNPNMDNIKDCLRHNLKISCWNVREADVVATDIKVIEPSSR